MLIEIALLSQGVSKVFQGMGGLLQIHQEKLKSFFSFLVMQWLYCKKVKPKATIEGIIENPAARFFLFIFLLIILIQTSVCIL